jgi:hypothetical protein
MTLMKIKLNDTQLQAIFEISRAIDELTARRSAMIDMAVASAGEQPTACKLERQEDGVYIVSQKPIETSEALPE